MVGVRTEPVKVGPFVFDASGTRATDEFDLADWRKAGHHLRKQASGFKWQVGDWCRLSDHAWGERYSLASRVTGLKEQSLRHIASTCEAFSRLCRRRHKLTFRHHTEVKGLPETEADAILARAEREKLSCAAVRKLVQERNRAAKSSPLKPPKPGGRYDKAETDPTPLDLWPVRNAIETLSQRTLSLVKGHPFIGGEFEAALRKYGVTITSTEEVQLAFKDAPVRIETVHTGVPALDQLLLAFEVALHAAAEAKETGKAVHQ